MLPPNITHLILDNNRISEINSTSLRDYKELQRLDLGMQNVTLIIRDNAFIRQSKLTELILGMNVGLTLEPRAFAGLFNLKYLFLDYCGLTESILSGNYLEPLLSLEGLDLFGNHIARLRPALFFPRLTKFKQLNLKLNQIERICEDDLAGFRGKNFIFLNLNSNHFYKTYNEGFDWESCGNPFRGMAFETLDFSSQGLNFDTTRRLFKAIEGTPIAHLIYSGHNGKGFAFKNLRDPDESTFEGLRNSTVNIIDLSKNHIFALQRSVFSPLKDTIIINIAQNQINQIHRNAFNGLQGNLRMLNLSFNLLGEIHAYTFNNLTELRVLDLSYNHIGVLGPAAFSHLPRLRALYLSGNSLRKLGFPASLPNLEVLLLADNKLNSLYHIHNFAMNSTHIDISSNRLTNMEDVYVILMNFKHLQNLFYGSNFIKWCTLNQGSSVTYNNSLQVLDLHDSSLQILWARGDCLDLFDGLNNLLGLNISLNSLTTFPPRIFKGLTSILEIDLSSNALTFLQADVLPASLVRLDLSNNFLASPDPTTFHSLSLLSLSGNRFHCDCTLESFLRWLYTTNVTFLSPIADFKCEFPAAVHDLPLLNYSTIVTPCEEDDEEAVQHLKLALFIFSASLVISVILSGIIYTRFRGHIFVIYKEIVKRVLEGPKPLPPENETQYDAFLCFSEGDYEWVEAALLKKLDNQFSEENMFNCCFEARDFLPGEDHLSNIHGAILSSRKTVCIISKAFLKGTIYRSKR